MKIMLYLLGIDTKLALAEVKSVMETFSKDCKLIENNGQSAVFEAEKPTLEKMGKRLALTHSIHEFIGKCPFNETGKFLEGIDIDIEMPFRVRIHYTETKPKIRAEELEKEYAGYFWDMSEKRGIKPSVDLKNPKTSIDFFIEEQTVYIGKKIYEIDKKQFRKTEPGNRPFRRPITMSSRTARVMVNFAKVKSGKVIDPFCGTGAILIEAGIVGLKPYGMDIKEDLIKGTKQNLEHFGIKGDLRIGDSRRLEYIFPVNYFDGIVTDLPYGISASMGKVEQSRLYQEAFSSMERVLKPDCLAVIAVPCEINLKTNMKLLGIHKEQMSTNLVRHIHIYRKVV
ncbi:MAG: methyltransferase domain-containing protein [Candidatus Aenigmarchaeota archaeon]|nr:methyltransferase domain-containing protein [Candidatus Aenigmarchaeota archaeon]